MSRWKLFAKGLMFLAIIRVVEWFPALDKGLGSGTELVPLWLEYNVWFEPTDLWLTDSFAYPMFAIYVVLIIWQFFRPSILGLIIVGVFQFQLNMVLYLYKTMADNWRLVCLLYAIIGMVLNQLQGVSSKEISWSKWVKYAMIGHLWLFYWVAVWYKVIHEDWQTGVSLTWIAWHPYWGASFPNVFSGPIFTHATVVLEVLFPLSWLFSATRKWGVLVGILFHTALMVFIPVVGFSLIMIWVLCMVLTEKEWTEITKALKVQRLVKLVTK